MSRRRRPEKREILPDPKFGDQVLSKFMNNLMYDGKKAVAEGIVYTALDTVEAKAKANPIELFHNALENIKPQVEVRSRRVGGATYQVPVEVRPERARSSGNHHGGPSFGRADGCGQQPRQCRQEARRHAPHGGREPRLLALPLVRRDGFGTGRGRCARPGLETVALIPTWGPSQLTPEL